MTEPFLFSVMPVNNTLDPLIGRADELRKIKSAILRFCNVSINGDYKIGKSSIMKTLEQDISADVEFQHIIPVYIDFDKFSFDISTDKLLGAILDNIYDANDEIYERFKGRELGKSHEFSRVIQYCGRKKKTVVLFLDNFDSVTVLGNLNSDFFKFLRGNAIENGLSIITASRGKLESLCHKGQLAGSQFWNVFAPIITLSIFENADHARQLLSLGLKNEATQNLILNNVGNNPCFLKVAANAVIQNSLLSSDDSLIIEAIYKDILPYYDKCWRLLKEDEKNVDNGVHYKLEYISTLLAINNGKTVSGTKFRKELDNLIQLGYLVYTDGKYMIYSPLFSRYLKEHDNFKAVPYSGKEPYIFISYSHEDKAEVMEEIKELCKNGYRLWFDDGLRIGEDWQEDLSKALDGATEVIVFISPHSVQSGSYVHKEIGVTLQRKIKINPVYLVETVLPTKIALAIADLQAAKKFEANYLERLYYNISPVCKTDN